MKKPRILLYDVETSPLLSHTWGRWEQNVIEVEREWFMLSVAWKWLGEKKIHVKTLPDYLGYNKNKECDKHLTRDLWKLFDEADILIGHNATRFDNKKSLARFAIHGFPPPSPFKTFDTLTAAKKQFAFSSNRLDDLGKQLGVGRKLPNTGKHLWLGCLAGDMRCWKQMAAYNVQDVALLERVYLKLRAWGSTHPNLAFYTRTDVCPVCQSSELHKDGWEYLRTGKRQRMACQSCSHKFKSGNLVKDAA